MAQPHPKDVYSVTPVHPAQKTSTALKLVLYIKIVITALFWSFPLLLPEPLLKPIVGSIGISLPDPLLFIRLLGAAYFALLVGYVLGVRNLQRGKDITSTVWVGIVSNGLACILLLHSGYAGTWQEWNSIAQIYMWLSAFLTGGITVGLISTGILIGGASPK